MDVTPFHHNYYTIMLLYLQWYNNTFLLFVHES
nr:MAG TPA: hypothetical protein [Caudoviricetes sp.]